MHLVQKSLCVSWCKGETAEWPLSRKFGCHPDMAIELLIQARELGLVPYGISFHVGSQQKDVAAWDDALAKVKYMFDWMKNEEGIKLQMINLGGGFQATTSVKSTRSKFMLKKSIVI